MKALVLQDDGCFGRVPSQLLEDYVLANLHKTFTLQPRLHAPTQPRHLEGGQLDAQQVHAHRFQDGAVLHGSLLADSVQGGTLCNLMRLVDTHEELPGSQGLPGSPSSRPPLPPLLDGPVDTELPFLEPPSAGKDNLADGLAGLQAAAQRPAHVDAAGQHPVRQLLLEGTGREPATQARSSSSGGCLQELEMLAAAETADLLREQPPGGGSASAHESLGTLLSQALGQPWAEGSRAGSGDDTNLGQSPAPGLAHMPLIGYEIRSPPLEEDRPDQECSSLIYDLDHPAATPLISSKPNTLGADACDEEVTGPLQRLPHGLPGMHSGSDTAAGPEACETLKDSERHSDSAPSRQHSAPASGGGAAVTAAGRAAAAEGSPATGAARAPGDMPQPATSGTRRSPSFDPSDTGHLRIRAYRPTQLGSKEGSPLQTPSKVQLAPLPADAKLDAGRNASPAKVCMYHTG
jgi:hypothetical protein